MRNSPDVSLKVAAARRGPQWPGTTRSTVSLCAVTLDEAESGRRHAPIADGPRGSDGEPAGEPPPGSRVRLRSRPTERRMRARIEDAEYVRGALQGDRAAHCAIVKRFSPLVRYSLSRTLSGPDLDDHVQEVFARCFANLAELRDPTSLRSFIIGIALRFASTERRRRRLRSWERLTHTGDLPELRVYQDDIESRQTARCVREILGRVRADTCRALELRFVHESELTEVAAYMGVSLATAKRHLARASACVRAMALGEPVLAECVGRRPP